MSHVRLIVLVVGAVALVALCAPAVALAGTYTWSQPGDFSGAQGMLNYGKASWNYDAGSSPSLSPLTFSSGQWSDASGDSISTSSGSVVMQAYQTSPGGPSGPLRVLFAYVELPGGSTHVISGVVPSEVARVLRKAKGAKVRVTTMLSSSGGPTSTVSAERSLQLK